MGIFSCGMWIGNELWMDELKGQGRILRILGGMGGTRAGGRIRLDCPLSISIFFFLICVLDIVTLHYDLLSDSL